ncbi:hypothetical protein SISSUDRAFT_1054880, partial [Sistotremastrum suecicum HHB10207 ss-3]
PLESEQMWSAVYEVATTKMKEEADEWKGLMDVSLVFIAIFLAVLTAFLVPAAQNLLPPPSSTSTGSNATSSPPPLPPQSDENVCALYYLALIMAMCNAVLCVIGRQWVSKLLSRPVGKTHRERTMRHEERKRLAYGWIKPLVSLLYWSLLLSIGLFIAGLLYQLRNLSTSFDQTATILEATWSLGICLASGIIALISATALHAIRFDTSPFEGLLSKLMVKMMGLLAQKWDAIAKWRVEVDWTSRSKLLKTYLELIVDANDPKLLDRAVPSFSYTAWVNYGDTKIDLLKRVYDRLMATDTSMRVRETVRAQILRFALHSPRVRPSYSLGYLFMLRPMPVSPVSKPPPSELIEFLLKQAPEAVEFPHFRAEITLTSYREHNDDLQGIELDSLEKCIARMLCAYDRSGPVGDRIDIYRKAFDHCNELLDTGKQDVVARIFSHAGRRSIVRSFLGCQEDTPVLYHYVSMPLFIVRDHHQDVLVWINEFLRHPPRRTLCPEYTENLLYLISPHGLSFPLDADFSPVIQHISKTTNLTIILTLRGKILDYLEGCNLSSLSNPSGVLSFIASRLTPYYFLMERMVLSNDEETCERARQLVARMAALGHIPLPPYARPPFGDSSAFEQRPRNGSDSPRTISLSFDESDTSRSPAASSLHLQIEAAD